MKILLTSTIGLVLIFFSLNNPFSDSEKKSESENLVHHNCACSATLGGTAEATCVDSQNCTCTSGFFSCSCRCSSPTQKNGTSLTIEYPGTRNVYRLDKLPNESHWLIVQSILEEEGSPIAQKLLDSMNGVYSLASKNPNAFLQKTTKLEAIYKTLPISIQSKLEQALK